MRLRGRLAKEGWSLDHPILGQASAVVEISVSDTGIGIAPEKQRIIIEAFQQADAGTARKYGGTGLDLAIRRELAHLLGGKLRLTSVPGSGSTFILYLPIAYMGAVSGPAQPRLAAAEPLALASPRLPLQAPLADELVDDRDALEPGVPLLLVIEDDRTTRGCC